MATTFERTYLYDYANGLVSALITGTSDGANDVGASLFDKSNFKGLDGAEPSQIKILRLTCLMQSYTSLRIYFKSTTDRNVARPAPGSGYLTWSRFAGLPPADLGGTGDVLLDSFGAVNGGTLTIQFDAQLVD